jgi:hypothetical protein
MRPPESKLVWRKANLFEQFFRTQIALGERPIQESERKSNILFDRPVREQSELLDDVAYLPPERNRIYPAHFFAVDHDLAARGFKEPVYKS